MNLSFFFSVLPSNERKHTILHPVPPISVAYRFRPKPWKGAKINLLFSFLITWCFWDSDGILSWLTHLETLWEQVTKIKWWNLCRTAESPKRHPEICFTRLRFLLLYVAACLGIVIAQTDSTAFMRMTWLRIRAMQCLAALINLSTVSKTVMMQF